MDAGSPEAGVPAAPSRMRSFDARRVGELECAAWVAYYGRKWLAFLRAALALTRHRFGLSRWASLRGAWHVMRANQLWAPVEGNDADGARDRMRRFYELVQKRSGESFDSAEAARLEVEWWRAHREMQGAGPGARPDRLVEVLVSLYAHVYSVPTASVRLAAEERALAMRYSDAWVAEAAAPTAP